MPLEPPTVPGSMRAHARLATAHVPTPHGGRSIVSDLHSEVPLQLRLTHAKGPEPGADQTAMPARVCIAAGAAGPVGGDRLRLDVLVGAGSTLILSDISATVLLPGPDGERSVTRTRIRVEAGGTLIWTPEPVIAARGSDHTNEITIDLADGARLFVRDELLLGRHAEKPGTVRQHVRVEYAGRPLYHQDLELGTHARGWPSPAMTDSHRAIGSVLIVDPTEGHASPTARALTDGLAVLPLSGPGTLISAVASNILDLREDLDAAMRALGPPSPRAQGK